jgi:fumarylacetoacetase
MRTGDLIGTGTVSGDVRLCFSCNTYQNSLADFHAQAVDEKGNKLELGCLFETTEAGTKSVTLDGGENLKFLKDGDEIILEGWCAGADGKLKLGFGECRGKIIGAS